MTFPLIFLAVVTCLAGFIPFGHFISSNGESYSIHLDLSVAVTSVVIAIISIGIATWMYKNAKQPVANALAELVFPIVVVADAAQRSLNTA